MSMLSAQCDELRSMAESVGLAMPQAATLMMEAADTIWELRDSVHRERAEADRLREQGARLFDKTLELGTENAKLCELVRDMHTVISDRNSWWDCMCKDTRRFANRMRELGVEVDE